MHGLSNDVDVEIAPMSPFMHGSVVFHAVLNILMLAWYSAVRGGREGGGRRGSSTIPIDPVPYLIEEPNNVFWPRRLLGEVHLARSAQRTPHEGTICTVVAH
jgi:hypothetical protein